MKKVQLCEKDVYQVIKKLCLENKYMLINIEYNHYRAFFRSIHEFLSFLFFLHLHIQYLKCSLKPIHWIIFYVSDMVWQSDSIAWFISFLHVRDYQVTICFKSTKCLCYVFLCIHLVLLSMTLIFYEISFIHNLQRIKHEKRYGFSLIWKVWLCINVSVFCCPNEVVYMENSVQLTRIQVCVHVVERYHLYRIRYGRYLF